MYTDTKNLAQSGSSLDISALSSMTMPLVHPPDHPPGGKPKGKLRRVWKPLIRLITQKPAHKAAPPAHPNNLNLNNHLSNLNNLQHNTNTNNNSNSNTYYHGKAGPQRLHEDYATRPVLPKAATGEQPTGAAVSQHREHPEQRDHRPKEPAGAPTVISSASIEKSPATTCRGCVYGRNCQHAQFHSDPLAYSQPLVVALPPAVEAPVQFVRTAEGTFYWSAAQDKLAAADDELLSAWLCHGLRLQGAADAPTVAH